MSILDRVRIEVEPFCECTGPAFPGGLDEPCGSRQEPRQPEGEDVESQSAAKWVLTAYPQIRRATAAFTWQRRVVDGDESWTGEWMVNVSDGPVDSAETIHGLGVAGSAMDAARVAVESYVDSFEWRRQVRFAERKAAEKATVAA